MENYGLDMHCGMILEEYRADMPVFEKIFEVAQDLLVKNIKAIGVIANSVEGRIKTEKSLAGKLERKGHKYAELKDLTDIVGLRVITFYTEDVNKVSSMVDHVFEIDWENSIDKRKQLALDRFGYNSLHYICRIPENLYKNPDFPQLNEYRFEIQMRTILQHAWATLDHDIGYKTDVEIPREYLRKIVRLSGILELCDEQFSQLRTGINNYRRQIQSLVSSGRFEDVPLDADTFRSYLELGPFDALTAKIAAINQAEITYSTAVPYLQVLKNFGFKTLGDVAGLISDYSEEAYQLAAYQLGNTDIDIVASTIAIQDLCEVYIIKNGGREQELKQMFDLLYGNNDYNGKRAQRICEQLKKFHFLGKE